MSDFIQLHVLTSYPPANLNRDDAGRPKTAIMGGVERLRVSSQSLKRSWRTSDLFADAMGGHVGRRTRRIGILAYEEFVNLEVGEKQALEWALKIGDVFGKMKNAKPKEKKDLLCEQLVHISPAEEEGVRLLARKLAAENRPATEDELLLLRKDSVAVDIALFGRMLASGANYNVEAACQVAHAISVHATEIEDDYFSAVDDLNSDEETGSAHIGETGFAAAVFYLNICLNRSLLVETLEGNEELANKAIRALTEAIVKVSPKGKQNSFASRAYANFVLAERGKQQPRSLSVAYLKPVSGEDFLGSAIEALKAQKDKFDLVYGACSDASYVMDAENGAGDLESLLNFVSK